MPYQFYQITNKDLKTIHRNIDAMLKDNPQLSFYDFIVRSFSLPDSNLISPVFSINIID